MAVGVVDAFEVVHVKEHHIGVLQVDARQQQVVACPVIGPGQLVMRGLEVQALQAAPVNLVHLVVGPGQIAEFLRAHLGDRAVGLDALHRVQNRVDAEARGQPDHEDHHGDLEQNNDPDQPHLVMQFVQRRSIRVIGHFFQFVQAGLHIGADFLFLGIIRVIQDHPGGQMHLVLSGKRPVLLGELHRPQDFGVLAVALCLDHQPHGIVFAVHQADGGCHGVLQASEGSLAALACGHLLDGLLPVLGFEGLGKVFRQKAHIPVNGEALYLFGQIVGGIHQLARGLSEFNLLLRSFGQMPKALSQMIGGEEHHGRDDRRADDHPQVDAPQRDAVFLFFCFVHILQTSGALLYPPLRRRRMRRKSRTGSGSTPHFVE